jgi:hypothetical protein
MSMYAKRMSAMVLFVVLALPMLAACDQEFELQRVSRPIIAHLLA